MSLSTYIKQQKQNKTRYSRLNKDPFTSLTPHYILKLKQSRHPSSYLLAHKFREKNKSRKPLFALVMIGVTIFTVFSIIASIIVTGWISDLEKECDENVKMRFGISENNQYWQIGIAEVWGGTLHLEQAKFQILNRDYNPILSIDYEEIQSFKPILRVDAKHYPVPAPIKFNEFGVVYKKLSQGTPIDKHTKISEYNGCTFLFVDENCNGQVNIDNTILIFKDWNGDGISEVKEGYWFRILNSSGDVVGAMELG